MNVSDFISNQMVNTEGKISSIKTLIFVKLPIEILNRMQILLSSLNSDEIIKKLLEKNEIKENEVVWKFNENYHIDYYLEYFDKNIWQTYDSYFSTSNFTPNKDRFMDFIWDNFEYFDQIYLKYKFEGSSISKKSLNNKSAKNILENECDCYL
jgi:hypothetical protein